MCKLFSLCVVALLFISCTPNPSGRTTNKAAGEANTQGLTALKNNGINSSIMHFTKAIELDPKYVDAYFNRGIAYGNLKKYKEAIADYTKAIELDPKEWTAYTNRGNAYSNLKKYPEAIADYIKAIELDSKDALAYYNRGNAYGNLKKYKEAIEDYTEAIELDPKLAAVYLVRGFTYNELKKYEEAIADYTKAIELDPKYVDAYNNRGFAFFDQKKYSDAAGDFTAAIKMYKTDDAAESYFGRILSYFHLGKLSEAAADFEKTKDLKPKYADAFYYRGLVNHQFKKYLEAITDFNSAIEFNPKNANTKYYAARGLSYKTLGKTKEAEADFVSANLVGALTVASQEVKPGKEKVIEFGKDVTLEMVLIPAGKFKMGSKKIPVDPFSNIKVAQPEEDEFPQHEVTLTKPFYMGKYEVTQEQWFEIMGENPSREKGRKLPVTDVSWNECHFFIRKLNEKTNGGYRLPTESEWEYACRAGTTTAYSFGDEITPKDANYVGSEIGKPVAIGSYKPNPFGLYDMHGNVWEWCEDWYGDYPAGAVIDPEGPATGEVRVLRGGSFTVYVLNGRSSGRFGNSPTARFDGYVGFRLARTK